MLSRISIALSIRFLPCRVPNLRQGQGKFGSPFWCIEHRPDFQSQRFSGVWLRREFGALVEHPLVNDGSEIASNHDPARKSLLSADQELTQKLIQINVVSCLKQYILLLTVILKSGLQS